MNYYLIDDCESIWLAAEDEEQALQMYAESVGYDSFEDALADFYDIAITPLSEDTIIDVRYDDKLDIPKHLKSKVKNEGGCFIVTDTVSNFSDGVRGIIASTLW